MTFQLIDAVPGTDTTVITERSGGHPDGRERVQSRVLWPPSPFNGQKQETRYPDQPARLAPDLPDAEKVGITRQRHERTCKGVAEGTITPPWMRDVPGAGSGDAVPVREAQTPAPMANPPFFAQRDPALTFHAHVDPVMLDATSLYGMQAALRMTVAERQAVVDAFRACGEEEEGRRS